MILSLGWSAAAHGASSLVKLENGEQLRGEVLPGSDETWLIMRSEWLGEIRVPKERVRVIEPLELAGDEVAQIPEVATASANPSKEPEVPTDSEGEEPVSSQKISENAVGVLKAVLSEEPRAVKSFRELKGPDHWSGNLRFGMNLSQGDNRWTETYARGRLEIDPPETPNFYRFTGSYTYRETVRANGDIIKSTDRYDGEFTYRRNFLNDWFFQKALGGRVDQVKGINYEIQDTVGIGYRHKPSDTFEFLIGGGGGIEDLDVSYEDTRSGFNPVVSVFQEVTWRPFKRTSIVQRFNYYRNPDDSEQFNYVFSAAVRLRLTDLLGFEFSFNKNFDNDVGDGNARDDTQWRNALVVYF